MEPVAIEGLVFLVNKNNPVDSLTKEQIVDIYTGKITNWKEVGGIDEPIEPFQRNEEAGSQTMMKKLVMKDTPLMDPVTTYVSGSMGGLIESIKGIDGSRTGAIGYSVYYYCKNMNMAEGLKILKVDGVEPCKESFRAGSYPYLNPYYVVIDKKTPSDALTRRLFNWLLSKDGQYLIDTQGYVSVIDGEICDEENIYADWTKNVSGESESAVLNYYSDTNRDVFVPSNNYGDVRVYYVLQGEDNMADESIRLYGLYFGEGKILTEPVYYDVSTNDNFIVMHKELSCYAINKKGTWLAGPYERVISMGDDNVAFLNDKNLVIINKEGKEIFNECLTDGYFNYYDFIGGMSGCRFIGDKRFIMSYYCHETDDSQAFAVVDLQSKELILNEEKEYYFYDADDNYPIKVFSYDKETNIDSCGFMDENGRLLIDCKYMWDESDYFIGDYCYLHSEDGFKGLIDINENIVYEVKSGNDLFFATEGNRYSSEFFDVGFYVEVSKIDEYLFVVSNAFDKDLKPVDFLEAGDEVYIFDESTYGNMHICKKTEDGFLIYTSKKEPVYIKGFDPANLSDMSRVYRRFTYNDNDYYYDLDGNVYGLENFSEYRNDYRFYMHDTNKGIRFVGINYISALLFAEQKSMIDRFSYLNINIGDPYAYAETDYYSGIYDIENCKWIIKYPKLNPDI